jgi:4-amino-4-deoxy-L-arabinose transferase-like glycosyltransferase
MWIDCGLILLLVGLIYGTRISSPPVRGEESRRATVTINFLETGNYIVPQQQGNIFYMSARPPAQNWLMLPFYALRGSMDAVTIRLPSIFAVAFTALLLYWFGRVWMSRGGAMVAALAYPTMLQVMELGRTAETDSVLTFFMTAGLLAWCYFYEERKKPAFAWAVGYAAIGLGTLTKGPQSPVYFFSATFVYLCWTRRWRKFFDWRHALGLCVYGAVVGAWLLPYFLMTSKAAVVHTFTGDVGVDKTETAKSIIVHFVTFPFALFGCMLPWSLLLLLFLRRSVRESARPLIVPLRFAAIAFCCALPTVWLAPGSKTRFLLNMFPCAALASGIAAECAFKSIDTHRADNPSQRPAKDLRCFTRVIACLAFAAALLILGLSAYAAVKDQDVRFATTLPHAILFAVLAIALGVALVAPRSLNGRPFLGSLYGVALFFGLVYNLPIVDYMDRWSEPNDQALQELWTRGVIPADRNLISIDECPHLINYFHYLQRHTTIAKVTVAQLKEMRQTNDVYYVSTSESFPLPHTVLARLPLRRYRSQRVYGEAAIIGKIPRASPP